MHRALADSGYGVCEFVSSVLRLSVFSTVAMLSSDV